MRDVLVVGGSLAGAATALHLARQGHDVLLVDRATFPRRKPCGEGLSAIGVAELARLGLDATRLGTPLTSLRFHIDGVSAEAAIGSSTHPVLGIERSRLDAALLDLAREAGVEVRTGQEARRLLRVDGAFVAEVNGAAEPARVLVAADGVRSALRAQASLDRPTPRNPRYGVSAHLMLDEEASNSIDVYFEDGYEVYVTPLGGNLINATILLRRSSMGLLKGDLVPAYESLIDRTGCLGSGFRLVDQPVAVGPFAAGARSLWRDNLLLVGDAAGFSDPITGEGMSLALVSARYCAAAIDSLLTTGTSQPLPIYERRRRALVRASTLFSGLMLALASRPALGRRAVANLARRPEVFRKLAAIHSGQLPLSALRPADVLGLVLGR